MGSASSGNVTGTVLLLARFPYTLSAPVERKRCGWAARKHPRTAFRQAALQ